VCQDGERKWVSGVLTAVRDQTGKLTGYIRVARDMTEQKLQAESLALIAIDRENRVDERTRQLEETVEELRLKNKEKEVLLREVYHRVKNNLQVVQSCSRCGRGIWEMPKPARRSRLPFNEST